MISINGDLKLEQIGKEKIDQIIALAKEIWIPSFKSYFTDEELWSLFQGMYNKDLLEETLSNSNYRYYFIFTTDEQLIGYLGLDLSNDSLKIDKIYIHPKLQGKGLGNKILAYLIENYKEKRIWLRVNRGNSGAVKLYEKHGFTVIERKDFHGPGKYKYEDFIMEKSPF